MPFGPNQINVGYGQSTNNPSGISNEVVPVNPAQTPANFVITGGSIDGTPIGVTTPSTGTFSSISDTGVTANTLAYFDVNKTLSSATIGAGLSFFSGTLSSTASGTVTSVNVSAGSTGLTTSGGPVTGSGTITLGGTLALTNGGTGATSASTARTALGVTATGSDTTYAYRANNLSDLASASTARTNLGLGTVATKTAPSGTSAQLLANDGSGGFSNVTVGSGLSLSAGTLSSTGGGSGTVTTVSVVSANGLAGTVANATTTPAITLSTSITGLLKGNGTAISAASAGTDYLTPSGSGSSLTGIVYTVAGNSGTVTQDQVTGLSTTGIIKRTGANTLAIASAGTDYQSAITFGTGVQTALGVNVGTAGSIVVNGGALGTPSSGTVTNFTGTASININGTVGATTANTGAFTTLSASSTVSGTGFSTYLASPPAIGGTAPAAGAFTTLSATGTITSTLATGTAPLTVASTTQVANLNVSQLVGATWIAPGTIGSTTPNTGAFTTLSASSTVSGTGFSTYLASPPAIGGTTAAAGSFTTLSASSTVSGTGFSTYLASPPAIGGIVSAAGTFTTLVDSIGNVRIIPQNSQSAAYTLVATDSGKHILHPSADTTARTFTIPANSSVAFAVGTAITFVNQNAAGVVTIAITSDTMRLAGAGTTGSRTLAANGVATAVKITSTEWIISGNGLT